MDSKNLMRARVLELGEQTRAQRRKKKKKNCEENMKRF